MQITQKGQVTIPVYIRESFGFMPHSEVDFVVIDNQVILKKVDSPFKKLKGLSKGKFTTEEIMRMTRGSE
jgi:AbrB family looped-hinge helix DNA binding protein